MPRRNDPDNRSRLCAWEWSSEATITKYRKESALFTKLHKELAFFTTLTKTKNKINVILVGSDVTLPLRLSDEPWAFNLENLNGYISDKK